MSFELSFQMILPDIKWYTININLRHQKRPQEVAIRRREHNVYNQMEKRAKGKQWSTNLYTES